MCSRSFPGEQHSHRRPSAGRAGGGAHTRGPDHPQVRSWGTWGHGPGWPATTVHGARRTLCCMAGLHPVFLLGPAGQVVKKLWRARLRPGCQEWRGWAGGEGLGSRLLCNLDSLGGEAGAGAVGMEGAFESERCSAFRVWRAGGVEGLCRMPGVLPTELGDAQPHPQPVPTFL